MSIDIQHISKQFGNFQALSDVSLNIGSGELVALLGPSGCGKTTLLRIIAGLESADTGQILFGGQDTTDVHVRQRGVGFVFQHYALFRHMTVFDNVAFGLRVKPRKERPDEAHIKARVHELLQMVQLDWLAGRYPSQLSGGQRQRIALARALAVAPKVLLLDEPFGALDAKVRKELRRWLRRLHEELNVTSIFVTHDQEEALEVADRVVVMNKGRIEQQGTPQEVWEHPASPFVYGFLGDVNLFHGRASGGQMQVGDWQLAAPDAPHAADAEALAQLPFVHSATPQVQASVTVRRGNFEKTASVSGVAPQYFEVRGKPLAAGRLFDQEDVARLALDAVIDDSTRQNLFQPHENPLGQVLILGTVPVRVIGVIGKETSGMGFDLGNTIWLPYSSVMGRITGSQTLENITVRIKDDWATHYAEAQITELLTRRHGSKDFFTSNSDTIRTMVEKTTFTIQLFISSIAVISLIVGGIGVMNIMLVSVTERTPEIGIRMAVGARRGDILQQFLIEAVLVCLLGGLLGIALAIGAGTAITHFSKEFTLVFSAPAIALAVACSTLIGVVFGFWPARNAARLNPVEALSRS